MSIDYEKLSTEKLPYLKKCVDESREYFQENIDRYNEFMQFVFKTSLTDQDKNTLEATGKPTIEFNIVEAFISRLRGEFAKQEPSLTVRAADGIPISMLTPDFIELINVVEAHLRAIFFDAANDKLEYNIYSDLLAGGWSVMQVYTDYVSERSFEQNIYVDRVFDPTLTGFDPMARTSHKGDGRYAFMLYPFTKSQFEEEFGKDRAKDFQFARDNSGFAWSFKNEKEDIALICEFYEKVIKRTKLLKLSNGHAVTEKEYEEFLEEWEESGRLEQPPIPVGKPRWTNIETIVRYRFCEDCILDKSPTNYKFLPLVFVDGNSVTLNNGSTSEQMTRPYVYHAKGIQQLKNFAGQSLGNELENLVQHKWIAANESIPVEYQEAYQNVQKADVLVYNHFLDKRSPEITLPPPREVNRTPIPPEVTNTFKLSDEMTQMILGSYDSSLGINDNQLSGVAIQNGAMQSNNASVPYIVGYIKGLNRVAQIIIDLIPKYYRTPRSLPILLPSGKRSYEIVNKKGSLFMNYDPTSLQVKVETGVNFAMQKEIALQTIVRLMQASPLFAQFINTYGLPILLDNIEIRGIEELKAKADEFQKQMEQQQQQQQQVQGQQMQQQQQISQMQMADMQRKLQQPTDIQLKMMELSQQGSVDAANVSIKERDSETKFIETLAKVRNMDVDAELEMAKVDSENERSAVMLAMETQKHIKDMTEIKAK
mgnify:CR=1 FL=1